jgi:hypothetical protein
MNIRNRISIGDRPMHTATETAAPAASIYQPGEALTREVTIREFVALAAPGLVQEFDDYECWGEFVEEGHEEARRLNLPISAEGRYPLVLWDVAWGRRGF